MRGRKPTPTAVKLLHNNPGRRPLNTDEPAHDPIDTTCPTELTHPKARAEWARVIDALTSTGHVTTVDRATLIGYCLKYGQWQALEETAAQHPFLVRAPSGYPIPNPAIGMANKAFALMLKAAVELGITPSSRSRIIAQAAESEDEFTAYQKRRRGVA